ncbi:MAG: hypothetical protein R3Y63_10130 [Eubacteriales bacterium]
MLNKTDDNYFDGGTNTDPILNWRFMMGKYPHEANQRLADGYYETCIELLNKCVTDNTDKKGDIWIFPSMFLAHQFIELYVKSINIFFLLIETPSKDPWEVPFQEGGHDLEKLLDLLKIELNKQSTVVYMPADDFQLLKDYVEIFSNKSGSARSIDLRYACNIKGSCQKETFYTKNTTNIYLNIQLYKQWIEEIHSILSSTYCNLENDYDSLTQND